MNAARTKASLCDCEALTRAKNNVLGRYTDVDELVLAMSLALPLIS